MARSRPENAGDLPPPADWPPGGWRIYGSGRSDRRAKGPIPPRLAMKAADPEFRDVPAGKLEEARQLLVDSDGDIEVRRRVRDLVLDAVAAGGHDPYLVAHALFLTFDLGDLRATACYLSRLQGPAVKALHLRDAALVLYVGGCLLQHLGRREDALAQFKAAADADPTEPRFPAAIAEEAYLLRCPSRRWWDGPAEKTPKWGAQWGRGATSAA